jgi:hypothetical protein
MLIVVN